MEQPQIDFKKTTPVLTESGSKIWQQGFVLRKLSRFVSGTDNDVIVPLQVFYDPQTMEINMEGIPPQIKFMFESEKPE